MVVFCVTVRESYCATCVGGVHMLCTPVKLSRWSYMVTVSRHPCSELNHADLVRYEVRGLSLTKSEV